MKRHRKYLVIIMIIVMMTQLFSYVFAQESAYSYTAEAQTLKDLGLYNGVSMQQAIIQLQQRLLIKAGLLLRKFLLIITVISFL